MKRDCDAERWRAAGISISPPVMSRANLKKLDLDAASQTSSPAKRVKPKKERGKRRSMGLDITWITDRIGVGGGIWSAANMAEAARIGITHIIDMQIEFDDTPLAVPHGIQVCWNPIDDDFEFKPPAVFERGVEFGLVALDQDGSKMFVHCAAGVHRAPMMTLALLAVMGWKMEEALDLIEGQRPVADFADVYVKSVENFLRQRR
jgi:hypothetical protein